MVIDDFPHEPYEFPQDPLRSGYPLVSRNRSRRQFAALWLITILRTTTPAV